MIDIINDLLRWMKKGGNVYKVYNEQTRQLDLIYDYDMEKGLYFLFNGDELIYVGKGQQISKRIRDHRKIDGWIFDSIYYIPNYSLIHFTENLILNDIQPKYNKKVKLI